MNGTGRQRAMDALRMHVPELAGVAVIELGHGLDNTAFIAEDLVLRVAAGRTVIREARLLKVVAERVSVPVPTPCFADEDAGVLAYPLISGRSLLGRSPSPGTAHRLGRFLRELHDIDPAAVDPLVPSEDANPSKWLEDLDGPPELLSLLHATVPLPTRQRVVAHADLGAEHILEQDSTLTGVIDWSDAAITDPALDFARLYRDFGPQFLADVLDSYGGLDHAGQALARIEFFARCAALEDLAYGQKNGRSQYARAAEHSFGWLFPHQAP